MEELRKKAAPWQQSHKLCGNNDEGPEILLSEVEYVIKQWKDKKVLGPNQVYGEIVKLTNGGGQIICKYEIYNMGILSQDWLKSNLIPVPNSLNHKTRYGLMSHVLKIYTKSNLQEWRSNRRATVRI